ncbi:unnamed protein product [Parascedosporium putredinis]|uniref:Uncharacterized protein n=1 Tax=Parascedosporium putredinis TaxID=1442378 RepID=A0A9P1H7H4_9PEZI|nr:unnamed protein product [Parascedosporium putredinis]CAI7998873.1 unnamed protein product [Parascedosporium putredinis]
MGVDEFLALLGEEVEDPDEETFLLFSQPIPSQNLGFLDPKASELEVAVGGRSTRSSSRRGSWSRLAPVARRVQSSGKSPPLRILARLPHKPLFTTSLLTPTSCVLELGCGTSGLIGLAAARRVARYTLTDQPYVARVLSANLAANNTLAKTTPSGAARKEKAKGKASNTRGVVSGVVTSGSGGSGDVVAFAPLDWELDVPTPP